MRQYLVLPTHLLQLLGGVLEIVAWFYRVDALTQFPSSASSVVSPESRMFPLMLQTVYRYSWRLLDSWVSPNVCVDRLLDIHSDECLLCLSDLILCGNFMLTVLRCDLLRNGFNPLQELVLRGLEFLPQSALLVLLLSPQLIHLREHVNSDQSLKLRSRGNASGMLPLKLVRSNTLSSLVLVVSPATIAIRSKSLRGLVLVVSLENAANHDTDGGNGDTLEDANEHQEEWIHGFQWW